MVLGRVWYSFVSDKEYVKRTGIICGAKKCVLVENEVLLFSSPVCASMENNKPCCFPLPTQYKLSDFLLERNCEFNKDKNICFPATCTN